MPDLIKRRSLVAQGLMENEALRENLDDVTAQQLFDWLLPQSEVIVDTTAEIEDDEAADEVIAPQLKAVRKLARQINSWVAYPDEDPAQMLDTLVQHAQTIYGESFTPPDQAQRDKFLHDAPAAVTQPAQLIQHIRQLFEGAAAAPVEPVLNATASADTPSPDAVPDEVSSADVPPDDAASATTAPGETSKDQPPVRRSWWQRLFCSKGDA